MSYRTKYIHLSGSGSVAGGECWVAGMYVNSTSSGTVKVYDYTSASGTIVNNTITPAIGYHNLGNVHCLTGCYIATTGTIDVTFHVIEKNN
ncbi:MAG: hypothetical protein PHT54_03590 [Candidatus Nanoarchaeia archaeon]|nr:hypothetical protein [Candidatus Nanoarchaeia archaeon]